MISTCNYPTTLLEKASLCFSLFARSPLNQCAKLAELHNDTKWNCIYYLGSFPTSSPTTSLFLTPMLHFFLCSFFYIQYLFQSSSFFFISMSSIYIHVPDISLCAHFYIPFLFVYSEQPKRKIQYLTHKNSYKPILFSKKKNTTIILTVESLQGYILLSVHSSVTSPFCLFLQEGLSF